jgi:cyclopropane fatty-acyl-phospholipid synthase-like methyltransferase
VWAKRRSGNKIIALILSSEAYDRLEQKFGKEGAKEIVNVLDASLQAVDNKVDEAIEGIIKIKLIFSLLKRNSS